MAFLAALSNTETPELNIHRIREFTETEHCEFKSTFSRFQHIRNKFKLIKIASINFQHLEFYASRFQSQTKTGNDPIAEFDRLFLNYFSSAYATKEHCKHRIISDHGKNSKEFQSFQNGLKLAEDRSFAFAFISDFRNFVQHCGFPTGELKRSSDSFGDHIFVGYDATKLLSDYSSWNKSKLLPSHGTLNLMDLAKDHHQVYTQFYSTHFLSSCENEVTTMHRYFSLLQLEATAACENSRAVIVERLEISNLKPNSSITFRDVPTNMLGELGLVLKK